MKGDCSLFWALFFWHEETAMNRLSPGVQAMIRSGIFRICLAVAILPVLFPACGKTAPPIAPGNRHDLVFDSADGIPLHATVYRPTNAAKSPPGLILVHMVGSNRGAWESFAMRAQRDGYLCLAFDARGHGESTGGTGQDLSYRRFTTQDWLSVRGDVAAAHKALLENGAHPNDVAVVGASIGANLALLYSSDHSDIAATVMVSPGLDYKGVETEQAIQKLGKRPVLLVTSQGDSYSAESCAALKKAASGLCELREYAGSAHGTNLVDGAANAAEDILLWLRPIIGPKS